MKYLRIIILPLFLLLLISDFADCQQADLQKTLRQAQLLKNRGLVQQAFTLYNNLYQSYPQNPSVVRGYASVLNALKMPGEVLSVYQSIHYEPAFDDQIILLESFLLLNRNTSADSLKDNILIKIRNVPLSSSLFNRLANVFIRYQHTQEAINILQEGYRANPDAHYLLSTIGYLQKSQMQYLESVQTFLQYLEKQKSAFGLVTSHILSMKLDKKQSESIYNLLKKTADRHPQDIRYTKLVVEFLIKQQKYTEALSQIQNLPPQEYSNYLLNISEEYLRQKKYKTAFQLLWNKIDSFPPGQRYKFYDILLKSIFGQIEGNTLFNDQLVNDIIQKIRADAANLGSNFPTLIFKYIKLYIAHTNDLDFGIRELTKLSQNKANPELKSEITLMLGKLYRFKNQLETSDSVFSSLLNSAPVKVTPKIKFELIKNQLYRSPNDTIIAHLDSLLLLISPEDSLSNNILGFMQVINFNLSDSLKLKVFKAFLLEEQKRYSEAATLYFHLFENSSGYEHYWCGLRSVSRYLQIHDVESAKKIIEILLTESLPDEIYQEVSFTKAQILIKHDNQPETAKSIMYELLEQFPNGKFNKQILNELEKMNEIKKTEHEKSI